MTTDFSGNTALKATQGPNALGAGGPDDATIDLPVDARSLLTAFDGSQTVGLCVLNRHHRLVHVNQTFARLIGQSPDRLLGERLAGFLSADSVDQARDTLNGVMRGEPATVSDWELLGPAGGSGVDLRIEAWFVDGRFGRPYLLLLAQPGAAQPAAAQPAAAVPDPLMEAPAEQPPAVPIQAKAALSQSDAAALVNATIQRARTAINRLRGEAKTAKAVATTQSREAVMASGREKLMHAIMKALPDTVFVLDRTGRIATVWSPLPEIAGIPAGRLHGLRIGQLFAPADVLRIKNALRDAKSSRPPAAITAQLVGRQGSDRRPFMELRFSNLQSQGIVAVMRDVTAQHRSREQLSRQVEHLDGMRQTFIDRGRQLTRLADRLGREKRRSDRIKATRTHFLATVSHEFRTPLNAILGFAEILHSELLGPIGNPRYRRYARDIVESGNLLLSLVDTVLSYEQAATDRLNLEPDRIDIHALIGEVLNLFGRWAGSMGISLEVDEPDSQPVLYADAKALRQMLANLVSNAVKFSDSGSTVRIRSGLGPDGKGAVISVEDRGIGMSREDIDLSMRPFGQVAEHPSGGRSGIGIGLPLTRHLIEEHGGKLTIASKAGVGTRVSLVFPPSSAMLPDSGPAEK